MATIQKRGNSYLIRVSCGYDARGKQVIQSKTWTPDEGLTTKQAKKELERQKILFEEECRNGFQARAVKFETFCNEWFDEYAKPNLRSTTYERLRGIGKRICKALGHLRMDRITARDIQLFVNTLSKNGANEHTGGVLSSKTIRHYLNFISDVFGYAVKMGVVSENPCSRVTVPKTVQREKKIYRPQDIERLLALLKDEPMKYRVYFNILVFSGFRRGEMMGLEWKDVDFENRLISVRRTSNYTVERGVYTDTTKTKQSQRTLKFPNAVFALLKEFKLEQEEEQKRLGNKWHDHDRLFVNDFGEPLHPNMPYYHLKRFCDKNSLPFYGLHSFRHSFASVLVNEGVDIVSVSGALGHSTVSTTSNIYCHIMENARTRVSDAVTSALHYNENDLADPEPK